jgi:hypothetical protein
VIDRDLRYVRINDRLAEINGMPAAGHIGRTVQEVVPDLNEQVIAMMRRVGQTNSRLQRSWISSRSAESFGRLCQLGPRRSCQLHAPLRRTDCRGESRKEAPMDLTFVEYSSAEHSEVQDNHLPRFGEENDNVRLWDWLAEAD